ncbi:sodium/calcium exchanger 3-like isoform X2 [Engraulis encrasicolus]|uniref:sodium/calcium exchanger 3-like isoform X2 n=1 Tax=Engraulis encrasicolus TaxID=184585 RepID=UPI002FD72308
MNGDLSPLPSLQLPFRSPLLLRRPFRLLLLLLLVLLHSRPGETASLTLPLSTPGNSSGGISGTVPQKQSCTEQVVCKDGVLLPVWLPLKPSLGEQAGRAILYFACLIYMFLGVSIIADRFMAAIEVITSQEREVKVTDANGEVTITKVRIWNETVSNLTLMALGSSAPEILLSVIEICGYGFTAGELGPSTIVGSAAFNMFVIIGLCVSSIPNNETRKIKHLRVFFITAFWGIFAYIWLYLILAVISPGIVQVWEALVTLLFFPLCVLQSWIADRRLLFYKYLHKRYRADKRHGIIIETEGGLAPKGIDVIMEEKSTSNSTSTIVSTDNSRDIEREREEMLKDLRQKHPDKDLDQLIEMANYNSMVAQRKSRAFYRVQVTRAMIGAGNVLRKYAAERQTRRANEAALAEVDLANTTCISFEQPQYQCSENCGAVSLWVTCQGGKRSNACLVDYQTENGSANSGSDYQYAQGTLEFKPGDTRKEIKIGIIDDEMFEEDEHFFVRLKDLREAEGPNSGEGPENTKLRLIEPQSATVTILDDDHAGIFSFVHKELRVSESSGAVEVTVTRSSGVRGTVAVPYRTEDGTARHGIDYEHTQGELEFINEVTSGVIKVPIINIAEHEKKENFYIILEEPKWLKRGISDAPSPEEEEARRIAEMGKPVLGEHSHLKVVIEDSTELKSTVDELLRDTDMAQVIGTTSWKEQFIEAVTVSAGDEDEENGEQRQPSGCDYCMHILTVFWKVLFAFVPPTGYCSGWACFVVSISLIGVLTAVIGDLASHFGCTVGLRDSVTALVFVALGTSIPDTFASKVAAVQDEYADASVGNVTGSNAVNVFLGIGVAWSVAAVYWEVKGEVFRVDPGSLAFSVTLYTIFALVCVAMLMFRRRPSIGGELGGPKGWKIFTSMLFFGLWFLYILFSSLEVYCHIKGF